MYGMELVEYFNKWRKSYFGNLNDKHNIRTSMTIFLLVFGGYTIAKFPKKLLNLFTNPLVQFVFFFIVYYTRYDDIDNQVVYSNKIKLYNSIFDSLVIVFIIWVIPKVSNIIFD